jgi:hypothetical protein
MVLGLASPRRAADDGLDDLPAPKEIERGQREGTREHQDDKWLHEETHACDDGQNRV